MVLTRGGCDDDSYCPGGTCTGPPGVCGAGSTCSSTGCTSDGGCKDYYGNPDHCYTIDGGGTGNYPCRDQDGRGKDNLATGTQALQPAYFWGNYFNGTLTGFYDVEPFILSGRDYCNHDASSDCGLKPAWTYTPRACPDPRTGLSRRCESTKYGTEGYALVDNSDTIPPAAPSGLSVQ